jgi:putative transposase
VAFSLKVVPASELAAAWTKIALAQLPAAFEHFNEVRPHSSLKMKSPR